jgi:aminopeptidase N
MRVEVAAPTVRLADYQPPAYLADSIDLVFRLDPRATRVRARIAFRRNPDRTADGPLDLRLDGRNLRLLAAAIDGADVPANGIATDAEGLTVAAALVPEAFTWEA